MPRDLVSEKTLKDLPKLESSNDLSRDKPSNQQTSPEPELSAPPKQIKDKISRDMEKEDHLNDIKPYTKSLTVSDVDSCVVLEEATFPPAERCSKEKFQYRFSKCGEMSLGLFTSAYPNRNFRDASVPTAATARTVSSDAPERKLLLLAHAVATKTTNETVTDDDMALPADWQTVGTANPSQGHKDEGRTICLHSLAVLPQFQGQGLGATLLKAYINRLEGSGVADRIALLAHDSLIQFYERFGFVNKGPSKAEFGGGGWVDMVLELKKTPKPQYEAS